jgi:precorrin-3B synthase
MSRAFARGACPGLSSPMETGDGLLARFLPAAPIPLDAFLALCQAARRHGNGIVEISARGSLQIRGLTLCSAPRFAEEVATLGLEICDSVPVIADPLPHDPTVLIDTTPISAALRRGVAEKALRLAPKLSIVIDGGGHIGLDRLFADIRLRAVAAPEGPRFEPALAGDAESATPLGAVAPDQAVAAVLNLLTRIAALGPEARAADLLDKGIRHKSSARHLGPRRADAIGLHALKGGALALGLGLAFGHSLAEALAELARAASTHGADWARPALGRALLLGPFNEEGLAATRQAASRLGFVTEASDPRRRIAACPGAPNCMHGLIAARALAAEIARHVPLPAGDGIALHVSGCAKGCAHPAPAPLTVVGTEKGCGIVREGTARDVPSDSIAVSELIPALAGKREAAHA